MQRDIDLMRKILLAIEASEEYLSFDTISDLAEQLGEDDDAYFHYQLELMLDEQLFRASDPTFGSTYPEFAIYQLTSKGCDVLDGIRTDNLYDQVKSFAQKAGLHVTSGLILRFLASRLM